VPAGGLPRLLIDGKRASGQGGGRDFALFGLHHRRGTATVATPVVVDLSKSNKPAE
jgi:hypothetical protein